MELKDYLTIIIPSVVSVLGFIVSIGLNKKESLQSLQKFKTEKQLTDLYGLQKDVLDFVDMLCKKMAYPEMQIDGFANLKEKINSMVIGAGTADAVKLIVYIHNMIYAKTDDNIEVSTCELIASYILLAMQLKYDTTGIKTSPQVWYVGKFTTQKMLSEGDFYAGSVKKINEIVDCLNLNSFLRIEPETSSLDMQ